MRLDGGRLLVRYLSFGFLPRSGFTARNDEQQSNRHECENAPQGRPERKCEDVDVPPHHSDHIVLLKKRIVDVGGGIGVTFRHQAAILGIPDKRVRDDMTCLGFTEAHDVTDFQRLRGVQDDDRTHRECRLHRATVDSLSLDAQLSKKHETTNDRHQNSVQPPGLPTARFAHLTVLAHCSSPLFPATFALWKTGHWLLEKLLPWKFPSVQPKWRAWMNLISFP